METKDRLLQVATSQFAERGFYGVSIAEVAEACGITKQSLLYHYGSKERLYEAVIRAISQNTLATLRSMEQTGESAASQLEAFFMAQFERAIEQPVASRVILRELMDNKRRAESVQDWILKPYLDGIADAVGRVAALGSRSWEERFAFAYQTQGAIFYYMISVPTLENMYGKNRFKKIQRGFRSVLKEQIGSFLDQ